MASSNSVFEVSGSLRASVPGLLLILTSSGSQETVGWLDFAIRERAGGFLCRFLLRRPRLCGFVIVQGDGDQTGTLSKLLPAQEKGRLHFIQGVLTLFQR